jgi:hypothetical protein
MIGRKCTGHPARNVARAGQATSSSSRRLRASLVLAAALGLFAVSSTSAAVFPTSVPVGQVAINIDPSTGDVLVDINLQSQSALQSVQFASSINNAFIPANYQGMQAHGFSSTWTNSGPSQTTTLIGEINQNGQTSFPTETVFDFGTFWSKTTNARDIQFTYNTVANSTTNPNVGTVTYLPAPEPTAAFGLAAFAAAGLFKRRRRSRA